MTWKATDALSATAGIRYFTESLEGVQVQTHPFGGFPATDTNLVPVPDPDQKPAESVPVGEPPSPIAPPSGCRFRTRCPRADQKCRDEVPELQAVRPGQYAACHHPLT